MRVWAKIKFEVEGFHSWEDAFDEVGFLSYTHRHMFLFVVWVEQMHNNRDVEYITLKRQLEKLYKSPVDFGGASCEMIAVNLLEWLKGMFGDRKLKVEVYEDGENGCLVETE